MVRRETWNSKRGFKQITLIFQLLCSTKGIHIAANETSHLLLSSRPVNVSAPLRIAMCCWECMLDHKQLEWATTNPLKVRIIRWLVRFKWNQLITIYKNKWSYTENYFYPGLNHHPFYVVFFFFFWLWFRMRLAVIRLGWWQKPNGQCLSVE